MNNIDPRLLSGEVTAISYCIGCACHDLKACACGCSWLRVDRDAARGVCSECADDVKRWDAGDRELRVPINDDMKVIGAIVNAAWQASPKDATAAAYVLGMVDVLYWLGDMTEAQRDEILALTGIPGPVPDVPAWVNES